MALKTTEEILLKFETGSLGHHSGGARLTRRDEVGLAIK